MKFGRTIASLLVATSLTAAPVVAQAAPAQRIGTDVQGENLGGGGWVIPLLALAAVILGIIAAVDDDEAPHSP